jgi:hypothetical protein
VAKREGRATTKSTPTTTRCIWVAPFHTKCANTRGRFPPQPHIGGTSTAPTDPFSRTDQAERHHPNLQ